MAVYCILLSMMVLLYVAVNATDDDPCDTTNVLYSSERSVANTYSLPGLCDNFLREGWFRIAGGAGDRMPTECPGGFKCNTFKPIYLGKDGIPDNDLFPSAGITVNRTAYTANIDGNCNHTSYHIKIKNCSQYFVYYLKSTIQDSCPTAYCFGNQLPCPNGTNSETGFTPGCETYPDIKVTPYVKASLLETEGVNQYGKIMVYSRATFQCLADDLQDNFTYATKWFVNDFEIIEAKVTNLSKSEIVNGLGLMKEEHWKSKFKPSMLVKCSIQVGGNGFRAYGTMQYSENFFAGIKIEQKTNSDYVVLEGKNITIPAELTMPLSCSWPKDAVDIQKKIIQSTDCVLILLTGIPSYQKNDQCANGIKDNGIIFQSETCGIKFAHNNWNQKQIITIIGQTDQVINNKDRIVFLRLYNSDEVTPNKDLIYWKNIHLPDIKAVVKDKDVQGKSCFSHNDPHMMTFDQRKWEMQKSDCTDGEYILYKHDRLPVQINIYVQECPQSTTVLCNCGIAVRSSDSFFIANFCRTKYQSVWKTNRYMKQMLCDDQHLVVEKTGTAYTITIPTGTIVSFDYTDDWINRVNIKPSVLDISLTQGLCGIYNGDTNDDFTPKESLQATTDIKVFANSWKVTNLEESLFNGTFKDPGYYAQQYCTCVAPDNKYPHGSPEYNCELTDAMQLCRNERTIKGVYTTSCIKLAKRFTSKSEYEQDDEEPPSFPMIPDDSLSLGITEQWTNGWTEESAKEHCTDKFQTAPAYNSCSVFVSSVNTEIFISECIADIKSTGGDNWLKVTVQNYASSCLQEAKRLEILAVTNGTNSTGAEKSVISIIQESTCPDNCSGHGICTDGECFCFSGFYGDLCSLVKAQAPYIEKDAFEGLCDEKRKLCQTFVIPGRNFIDEASLTCQFTKFSLNFNGTTLVLATFINIGKYSSAFLMYCKLPDSRKKRSADFEVVATGYRISVSNDGNNYSEPLTTLVYNSLCYECNITTIKCEKLASCPVTAAVTEDRTKMSWIAAAVILPVSGVAGVVAVLVFCILKHYRPKKLHRRSSTVSISTEFQNIAPQRYVGNSETVLCERYK